MFGANARPPGAGAPPWHHVPTAPARPPFFRSQSSAHKGSPTHFRTIPLIATLIATFTGPPAIAGPLYPNSIVSNDLEFIKTTDPAPTHQLFYQGQSRAEMPDKRGGDLFANNVHIIDARYADGPSFGIWLHPKLGTKEDVAPIAQTIATTAAKLPRAMRRTLQHVVVHIGRETAFAEDSGHFFVLNDANIRDRLSTHDLEETLFHEAVHATLDAGWASSPKWRAAQQADAAFVTKYAAQNPNREDLAESALFAYALITHPGRLPASLETKLRATIPNRIAFFETLFVSLE